MKIIRKIVLGIWLALFIGGFTALGVYIVIVDGWLSLLYTFLITLLALIAWLFVVFSLILLFESDN